MAYTNIVALYRPPLNCDTSVRPCNNLKNTEKLCRFLLSSGYCPQACRPSWILQSSVELRYTYSYTFRFHEPQGVCSELHISNLIPRF